MSISWKCFLGASFLAAAMAWPVQAALIIDTTVSTPGNAIAIRLAGNSQGGVTSKLVVGSNDVAIGSFGMYGQLSTTGNLKWLIFSSSIGSGPIFSTASTPTPAATSAQWYVSPETDFTLKANTTYYLGVISDQTFTYYYDGSGLTVTSGGLKALAANGNTGPSYANPINYGDGGGLIFFEAFTPNAVPEPSSLALCTIAGLIGSGVAWSRRRRLAA